jgi:hypothetical protein
MNTFEGPKVMSGLNQADTLAQPTLIDTFIPAATDNWLYKAILVLWGCLFIVEV